LPQQEIAKVKAKGVYSQSVEDVCIKHDGHCFCTLRSIVVLFIFVKLIFKN